MKFKEAGFDSEKYFATGLIFTVLSLYCISIYGYFSNQQEEIPSYHNDVTALVPPSNSEPLKSASSLEVARTSSILNITNGEEALFQPINAGSRIYVPGTECTLTDLNLTPAGVLYGIPETCDFLLEGVE